MRQCVAYRRELCNLPKKGRKELTMDTMLSKALRAFMTGPLKQLIVNLGGEDGDQVETELNKFNRKEPCWVNIRSLSSSGFNLPTDFIRETFRFWYDEEKSQVELKPVIINPRHQDYAKLAKDVDPSGFGQYSLSFEMQSVDFRKIIPAGKIKILDLQEFNDKLLYEVVRHIMDTYGNTHMIPDIRFIEWISKNLDNSPAKIQKEYGIMKDGNFYFYFGSLVRRSDGHWGVPNDEWDRTSWARRTSWLDSNWRKYYRVVLFEI